MLKYIEIGGRISEGIFRMQVVAPSQFVKMLLSNDPPGDGSHHSPVAPCAAALYSTPTNVTLFA